MSRLWIWLALALVLAGGVVWLDQSAYQRGQRDERLAWQAAAGRQATEVAARRSRDEQAVRRREAEHAAALAAIDRAGQERIRNVEIENGRLRAALRAGDVRLRVPAGGVGLAAGEAGAAGTGAGRGDACTGGELSPALADDLFALVADADAVAEQLGRCQAVIRADRELVQ